MQGSNIVEVFRHLRKPSLLGSERGGTTTKNQTNVQPKHRHGAPREHYTPTRVQFPAGQPGHGSACRKEKQKSRKPTLLFPHLSGLDPNRQWQSNEEYL